MARSSLFQQSKKFLKLASKANKYQVSATEIQNHLKENYLHKNISRRDFLKGLALGTAVFGLNTYGFAQGSTSKINQKITILGGGLAGLTVAYRLMKANIPCEIYEARERLGGRVQSKYNFNPEGMFCELGGEFVDTEHTKLIALCRELAVKTESFGNTDLKLAPAIYFFGGKIRTEKELITNFQPLAKVIERDLESIFDEEEVEIPTYKTPFRSKRFDNISIEEYLNSQKGVEKWVLDFLKIAYTTEYGSEPSQQSALNLILLIGLDTNEGLELYGDSDEAMRITGGNSKLIEALHEKIKGTVPIYFGYTLLKIEDTGLNIRMTFGQSQGKTLVIESPRVACTIPFSILREIDGVSDLNLNPLKRKAILEYGYGSNAKAIFGFTNRFWRADTAKPYPARGHIFSDLNCQTFWETSRLQKGNHGILTNFMGGNQGKSIPAQKIENTLQELNKIYPEASNNFDQNKAFKYWVLDPLNKGSYTSLKPGQYTSINGVSKESELQGRLLFAGEHCSVDFAGYMNGAIESGNSLAGSIIKGN
jgi:monoamine oxidase